MLLSSVQKIRMKLSWTRGDIERMANMIYHLIDHNTTLSEELDHALDTIDELYQELDHQAQKNRHLRIAE